MKTGDVQTKEEKVEVSTSPDANSAPAAILEPGQKERDTTDQGQDPAAKAARSKREAGWKDYIRVFSYGKKWDIVMMVTAGLASVGTGATLPVMNVVFGKLVGSFSSFGTPGSSFTRADFEKEINTLVTYMAIIFAGRFFLTYINRFCFRMIGIRMSAAIRDHYLQCLFKQSVHVLDSMPSGAAAATITGTANVLQMGISEKLGIFIESLTMIIGFVVVAFVFSWRLTLVTSTCLVAIILTAGITLPYILKNQAKYNTADAQATAVASEAFSSIRMVYACGAESRMVQRYTRWVEEAKKHGQATSPLFAATLGLVWFSMFGGFALCFWYGALLYSEGVVDSVGTVVIVLMSVVMMTVAMERVTTPLIAGSKAMLAAAEFFAIIDAPTPDSGTLREPDVSASTDIQFSGVDFAYPGRPHVKVLDDLDLTIGAGKVTAIVGPSGSGKSTIVGLVERWYTLREQYAIQKVVGKDDKKKKKNRKAEVEEEDAPEIPEAETGPPVQLKGSITTSGVALDQIDIKWWRSQIGLVQQEPFLFNDTIYVNVMHGLIGTQWENEPLETKKELVRDACKEAFADEFIDRLPQGYDTHVGESGLKLSGGQRQRLAIARSIAKKPKILILDEATSAVDVRSEKIIQAALDKVSIGRTTIMIAHRLSTIRKADRIVVLQKGKLVEQGTHEELVQNEDGVYHGLIEAQKLGLDGRTGENESDEEEDIDAVLSREKSAAKSEHETATDTTSTGWKNKGLLGSFGKLLYELKGLFPQYIIIVLGAMVVAAATPMQAYIFAHSIGVFSGSMNHIRSDGSFWGLMWFILALTTSTGHWIVTFTAIRLQYFISAVYRKQYFNALIHQKIAFFDDSTDNSAGSLTARVSSEPRQLEELLGMNMALAATSAFQVIGAMAIAFAFGWKLALIASCLIIPVGLISSYYRFRAEMDAEKSNAAVFAESSKWAAESIGAFRTVSALTLESIIAQRYGDLLRDHVRTAFGKTRWSALLFALSESVSMGCQALLFWYGARLMASGEYSLVNFFVCYQAAVLGGEQAGMGFSLGPNAAQASSAANRILGMRDSHARDRAGSGRGTIPRPEGGEGGVKIELKNVAFKYPTRNVSIFKDLNITIEKGQFAALVGASGSGKTSIVSLLERFYDATGGKVMCNGVDIRDVDVYEYRKLLSLVAQEPNIFQGTVKENILLGVDPATVSDARLHSVCRDAAIHDFIVSLPDGYATDVGSKGVALSGGQKQRLGIARAIVRDPQILLLDEATSSLDSESEKAISAALQRVAVGRTTVAVAHRLSTIQHADIIYVLGEGRVLEQGNHGELLRKKGIYWHMCHSQALDR